MAVELHRLSRQLNVLLFACAWLASSRTIAVEPAPINRHALVSRHNPVNKEVDSLSPFTLGNGKFAFTADVTGLQSFPEEYDAGIPPEHAIAVGLAQLPQSSRI